MQDLEILFKNYTQSAETINSSLSLVNGYYVYSDSIGGGVVNEFNVKDFLDNNNNVTVATSYFDFLKLNSTQEEFKEIFYNNKKLASSFNEFYVNTTVSAGTVNRNLVTSQLTNTSAYTYFDNYFTNDSSNKRTNKKVTTLVSFNTGQSYYVSVYLTSAKAEVQNYDFSNYFADRFGDTGITLTVFRESYLRQPSIGLPSTRSSNTNRQTVFDELFELKKELNTLKSDLNALLLNEDRGLTPSEKIINDQKKLDVTKKIEESKIKVERKEVEFLEAYSDVYEERNTRYETEVVAKNLMLNGFVFYNYNDSESGYWTNDYILTSDTKNKTFYLVDEDAFDKALSELETKLSEVEAGTGRG